MKPPCEMVVWYIIPAIRSELAKIWISKRFIEIRNETKEDIWINGYYTTCCFSVFNW